MHKEILTKEQVQILPLIKKFYNDFGLVGGTAFALILGHRRSIDFDLFSNQDFNNLNIKKRVAHFKEIDNIFVNRKGEFTFLINNVKITFFHYPFKIDFFEEFENIIKMPDLLTLAAMKAYALGMRAKWKDYVDLYFTAHDHFSIKEIADRANKIFGAEFNEKLFRSQLAYSKDIDYTEKVIYLPGLEVPDKIIRKKLKEVSLNF